MGGDGERYMMVGYLKRGIEEKRWWGEGCMLCRKKNGYGGNERGWVGVLC